MQLTATRPDENLEALATRVYDLGDRPSQGTIRAAVRALRDANPSLHRMSDLAPGTIVEVPPLDEAAHRPGETMTEDALATGVVRDYVTAAADLLRRQLVEDLSAELSEAKETVKLARSPALRQAKAAGVTEAVAAAEARMAAAKEVQTRHEAVLRQLNVDLSNFTGVHGGTG